MSKLAGYFHTTEKDPRKLLITFIGAFFAIAVTAWADLEFNDPYLVTSFGATAVLIFAVPDGPLSKPKNVFFGHLFSAFIGAMCVILLGVEWYSIAAAVALAIVVMVCTDTIHPPGGATALTMVFSNYDSLWYIIRPVMIGIVFLMIVGYVCRRARHWCDAHPLEAAD